MVHPDRRRDRLQHQLLGQRRLPHTQINTESTPFNDKLPPQTQQGTSDTEGYSQASQPAAAGVRQGKAKPSRPLPLAAPGCAPQRQTDQHVSPGPSPTRTSTSTRTSTTTRGKGGAGQCTGGAAVWAPSPPMGAHWTSIAILARVAFRVPSYY
jgi:hypothetical protein